MTTATTEQQTPDIDLDTLEADARQKIEEAEDAEARLSLDALSDPEVANALREVRSERNAAQDALRQIALARGESDRRAIAARQEAERKAREKAARQAHALDAKVQQAAKHADTAADEFAAAVVAHRDLAERRQKLLHAAGLVRDPWLPMGAYQVALLAALAEHGCANWFGFAGGGVPVRLEDQ